MSALVSSRVLKSTEGFVVCSSGWLCERGSVFVNLFSHRGDVLAGEGGSGIFTGVVGGVSRMLYVRRNSSRAAACFFFVIYVPVVPVFSIASLLFVGGRPFDCTHSLNSSNDMSNCFCRVCTFNIFDASAYVASKDANFALCAVSVLFCPLFTCIIQMACFFFHFDLVRSALAIANVHGPTRTVQ